MIGTLLERGRRGESLADIGIIDMHGHLGRTNFCIPDLSPGSLVATMDRLGVASIVCSPIRVFGTHVEVGNREVLEASQAFPDRILGYVGLWPADARAARAEAERYFNEGFVGIKLHDASGFPYTDPGYAEALALANERHTLLLLHTWGQPQQFDQVRRLSEAYPDVSILLAHSGSQQEEQYVAVARECGNVHLDLCLSLTRRGMVDRLVAGAGADKVLWGSDALFLGMEHQLGKMLGSRLADDVKVQVLSGNARRLLDRIQH